MQLAMKPLDFKPGTHFSYSNSGYFVLADLLEMVSGEAYGPFLQQHIFSSLQMSHIDYDYTQPHLANMATGYKAKQFKLVRSSKNYR